VKELLNACEANDDDESKKIADFVVESGWYFCTLNLHKNKRFPGAADACSVGPLFELGR
jgi:hypothetical protein